MLMDILMESLMSMDEDTLDYVLESCSDEEIDIISSAMETISSDGKHHQTKPGSVNHARKANEMMPRIDAKINRLKAVVNRDKATDDDCMYSDVRKPGKSEWSLDKYERIKEKLEPVEYDSEARVIRDRGIGFTPQGAKDIAEANAAMKIDKYADVMPRYTSKKK